MRMPLDLTGQRFGRLTAIASTNMRSPQGGVIWRCNCDCGKEKFTSVNELKAVINGTGGVRSCGCLKTGRPVKSVVLGKRFGLLTVIFRTTERNGSGKPLFKCVCDCGKERLFSEKQLKSRFGRKSCGCM